VKNFVSIISLTLLFTLASFIPVGVRDIRVNKVVIDAGHGGKDSGTIGKFSKEKDVALKIARELGSIINKYLKDVEVIYTRDNDTFVELEQRAHSRAPVCCPWSAHQGGQFIASFAALGFVL
jgi:N-acetylmuramoyl-L-alanine amidase